MWRLIAITSEKEIKDEISKIEELIDKGFSYIHLRKPSLSEEETRKILERIPHHLLEKITLHDYIHLAKEYNLGGIHSNRRNRYNKPIDFEGRFSCSCHSFDDIKANKDNYDYLFLSPIFDSISKRGYKSNFSINDLKQAKLSGVIDDKVIALGGVTAQHYDLLKEIGFGGVAMIGTIWES